MRELPYEEGNKVKILIMTLGQMEFSAGLFGAAAKFR